MDKIINAAKDLGRLIQQDKRFYDFLVAQQAYEDDLELGEITQKFEAKRSEITLEVQKTDKDPDIIKELDKEVKSLFELITTNPKYVKLNEAQNDMQQMLNNVNQIITGSASGEDPETIDYTTGCSPSGCSGCSGC